MDNNREIELKLAIHPDDVRAFCRLPFLREHAVARRLRQQVFNVYFDTAGCTLAKHGMSLRLRHVNGTRQQTRQQTWQQTLKTAEAAGALQQRGEWQQALPGGQLDLSLLRATPLAKLKRRKQLHRLLKPKFTTTFTRTSWRLALAPGQQVEVALDEGDIICGDRHAPISEIEIELITGDVGAVFEVADALLANINLTPAPLTKAARGYRLLDPAPPAPTSATRITLRRKWPPPRAMRAIIAAGLEHFAANLDGALHRDDPEYIHQLRVALRRLRTAFGIFRPADAQPLADELKWLCAALGQTRDLDVLVDVCLPALCAHLGDSRVAKQMMDTAEQHRRDARVAARITLASVRATALWLALSRWLHTAEKATPPRADLAEFAARQIRRRQHLLRRTTTLRTLTDAQRHRLRIAAKRLRYTIEFFADVTRSRRRFTKELALLQDALGAIHDNSVAGRMIADLAAPDVEFGRGWFAARTESQIAAADQSMRVLRRLEVKTRRNKHKHQSRVSAIFA